MANSLTYGFYDLRDYAQTLSVNIAPDDMRRAVLLSSAEYNAEVNTILNLFAEPTEEVKLRFTAAGNPRLQPGTEFSRALPVKMSTYDVAFPMLKGDHAWGATQLARYERTVQNDNDDLNFAFKADRNWLADHVLAGIFYNGSGWTHTDKKYGNLTIVGLANGDTVQYERVGGGPATDTHYLAQAAAIADATNPFPTIRSELMEHPENEGAEIINFVPTSNVAAATGLGVFRDLDDPTVREASTISVVTGNPNVTFPGTLLGRANQQWLVEWPRLPADYIVSLAVGPGVAPPLAMRQHPNDEAKGFRPRGDRDDYPYFEQQLWRLAGFGPWNRVGAVVTRVSNGTYAIPTNYGSPMP